MVKVHKKVEKIEGDAAKDEAGVCYQVITVLKNFGQCGLKVSQDWNVSVVSLPGSQPPANADIVERYFNERPYLLCSKDLYVYVKMPWWEKGHYPSGISEDVDDYNFVHDVVVPNPYPAFQKTFIEPKRNRKVLRKPEGWKYPDRLTTSLWYQEANPLYVGDNSSRFAARAPPKGIPTPKQKSKIEGRSASSLLESSWSMIPRPALVKAPTSHQAFSIAPKELKILGYELQKAAKKAATAAAFRIRHSALEPPAHMGISQTFHYSALAYEALATYHAARSCFEAAEVDLSLFVPAGGVMPSWKGGPPVNTDPSVDQLISSLPRFLRMRPWLMFTADMTLRLQIDQLAQPATGNRSTVVACWELAPPWIT